MNFDSWPIVRTRPLGITYGRSISLFINTSDSCCLTTADVYEDGSVHCWGFVDLELFLEKLSSNRIVPAPAKNQRLSVHNFGKTRIKNGTWGQTSESIAQEVKAIVRRLNPEMKNLIDMEGSATVIRDRVRYSKMGLPDEIPEKYLNPLGRSSAELPSNPDEFLDHPDQTDMTFSVPDEKPYRKTLEAGAVIIGDFVPILFGTGDTLELSQLFVFADGMCRIGSTGKLFPVSDVPSLYERGRISNHAPAGRKVRLTGLGEFETTVPFGDISVPDRIKQIHGMLDKLVGTPRESASVNN